VDTSLVGEQSVPSNGKHIQQAFCVPDKMMDFSRLSQFGMMFKPLMVFSGEALLMSYLEDFHAKISLSRGGGAGIDGERSGMWREMARIIHEVQPRFVFVENSPMLTSRGLGVVLGDLASMGFDARWCVLGAADIGANHQRDRIWIVAKMANSRCKLRSKGNTTNLEPKKKVRSFSAIHNKPSSSGYGSKEWWQTEPKLDRMVDGVAYGVDRLKAIGNGQVPLCAATAWRILSESF